MEAINIVLTQAATEDLPSLYTYRLVTRLSSLILLTTFILKIIYMSIMYMKNLVLVKSEGQLILVTLSIKSNFKSTNQKHTQVLYSKVLLFVCMKYSIYIMHSDLFTTLSSRWVYVIQYIYIHAFRQLLPSFKALDDKTNYSFGLLVKKKG